jgi:hypothetical protein
MVYKQIKINITRPQLQKAINGKPVQFSASQIGSGSTYLSLHPANVKLVEKAAMKGSGCVIHLSPGELMSSAEDDISGNGLFGDIWKGLKSGYKWVKKNIVDTPIYQQGLKPLVRQAVNTAATAAKSFAPQLGTAIDMGVNELGKQTGAFGVKRGKMSKTKKYETLKAKGLYLS